MTLHDQFGTARTGGMMLAQYYHKYDSLAAMRHKNWQSKQHQLLFSANPNASHRGKRDELFKLKSQYARIVVETLPMYEYSNYRYLVYAYGNCGWSRRMHELIPLNATMLVQDSECHEYYTSFFQPYKHYIPVAEDFSDVKEKLEAIAQDPVESERMASEWVAIGHDLLDLTCVLDYLETMLRGYAQLQLFTPNERLDWFEYHFTSTFRDIRDFILTQDPCDPVPGAEHGFPIHPNLTQC
jgi:hypothetical protein